MIYLLQSVLDLCHIVPHLCDIGILTDKQQHRVIQTGTIGSLRHHLTDQARQHADRTVTLLLAHPAVDHRQTVDITDRHSHRISQFGMAVFKSLFHAGFGVKARQQIDGQRTVRKHKQPSQDPVFVIPQHRIITAVEDMLLSLYKLPLKSMILIQIF